MARWSIERRGTDLMLGGWFEREEDAEEYAAKLNVKHDTDAFEVRAL